MMKRASSKRSSAYRSSHSSSSFRRSHTQITARKHPGRKYDAWEGEEGVSPLEDPTKSQFERITDNDGAQVLEKFNQSLSPWLTHKTGNTVYLASGHYSDDDDFENSDEYTSDEESGVNEWKTQEVVFPTAYREAANTRRRSTSSGQSNTSFGSQTSIRLCVRRSSQGRKAARRSVHGRMKENVRLSTRFIDPSLLEEESELYDNTEVDINGHCMSNEQSTGKTHLPAQQQQQQQNCLVKPCEKFIDTLKSESVFSLTAVRSPPPLRPAPRPPTSSEQTVAGGIKRGGSQFLMLRRIGDHGCSGAASVNTPGTEEREITARRESVGGLPVDSKAQRKVLEASSQHDPSIGSLKNGMPRVSNSRISVNPSDMYSAGSSSYLTAELVTPPNRKCSLAGPALSTRNPTSPNRKHSLDHSLDTLRVMLTKQKRRLSTHRSGSASSRLYNLKGTASTGETEFEKTRTGNTCDSLSEDLNRTSLSNINVVSQRTNLHLQLHRFRLVDEGKQVLKQRKVVFCMNQESQTFITHTQSPREACQLGIFEQVVFRMGSTSKRKPIRIKLMGVGHGKRLMRTVGDLYLHLDAETNTSSSGCCPTKWATLINKKGERVAEVSVKLWFSSRTDGTDVHYQDHKVNRLERLRKMSVTLLNGLKRRPSNDNECVQQIKLPSPKCPDQRRNSEDKRTRTTLTETQRGSKLWTMDFGRKLGRKSSTETEQGLGYTYGPKELPVDRATSRAKLIHK